LPSYAKVFTQVEDYVKREVTEVMERAAGTTVIPEIDYADLDANRVSADRVTAIKRRWGGGRAASVLTGEGRSVE